MLAETLSVETYLTAQIREILGYGAQHALTWADRADPHCWLQLSVHDGSRHYLCVQFPRPAHLSRRRFDALFRAPGWEQRQMDGSESLTYYLAVSTAPESLFAQAEVVAQQCARAMQLLWDATSVAQIALLAARGPRIPLPASATHALVRSRAA